MKKSLRSILSLLLAFVMLAVLLPANVFAEEYPVLTTQSPVFVFPQNYEQEISVSFTPQTSGYYRFESDYEHLSDQQNPDPVIRDLFSDGHVPDRIGGETDDYHGLNFNAIYDLIGGKTYTLLLSTYSSPDYGYTVRVSEARGLIKDPTEDDPSVTVYPPEDVASYQWYEGYWRDYPLTNVNVAVKKGQYDAQREAWVGGNVNHDQVEIFSVALEEDQTLFINNVALSQAPQLEIRVETEDSSFQNPLYWYQEQAQFYVSEDAVLTLILTSPAEYALECYADYYDLVPAVGQNTDTLTAAKHDYSYFCEVTLKDGTVCRSNSIHFYYGIYDFYGNSVSASHSDFATFRWYEATPASSTVITDQNAIVFPEGKKAAKYDAQNGVWVSDFKEEDQEEGRHYLFGVALNKNEQLQLTSYDVDPYSIHAFVPREDGWFYYSECLSYRGNTAFFSAPEDGVYYFYSYDYYMDAAFTAKKVSFTFKAIPGETYQSLSNYASDKYYTCKVNWIDGTEIWSSALPVYHNAGGGSAETPVVYSNYMHEAEFQWYLAPEITSPVTDSVATKAENIIYDADSDLWSGEYKLNGYGMKVLDIELEAGEVIALADFPFASGCYLSDGIGAIEFYWDDGLGVYLCEIYETRSYGLYIIGDQEQHFALQVMTGKNSKILEGETNPWITNTVPGKGYFCKITINSSLAGDGASVVRANSFIASDITSFCGQELEAVYTNFSRQTLLDLANKGKALLENPNLTEEDKNHVQNQIEMYEKIASDFPTFLEMMLKEALRDENGNVHLEVSNLLDVLPYISAIGTLTPAELEDFDPEALAIAIEATRQLTNLMIPYGQWGMEGSRWVYYVEGLKLVNSLVPDSKGYCYVDENGYMVYNRWIHDGIGWRFFGPDGYMVTNAWSKDSVGWCYVGEDGYMIANDWAKDSAGLCYVGEGGYLVENTWVWDGFGWKYAGAGGYLATNSWRRDSVGWCYVGEDGYMAANTWVPDSKGMCYIDQNGYCVTNTWAKYEGVWCYLDSEGSQIKNAWVLNGTEWIYLGSNGFSLLGQWMNDSAGWCYLGVNGFMQKNAWIPDSVGICRVDASGYMVYNTWIHDGIGWRYVDGNGYVLCNAWQKDSFGWCYVGEDGYMYADRWHFDSVGLCYIGAEGYCLTNTFVQYEDKWVYLNENGSQVKNSLVVFESSIYFVDADGFRVENETVNIDGTDYTFGADGKLIQE